MVCNNSTIKYVLSWTLVCKVSCQEWLPFQTNKQKNPNQLSNHFKNEFSACEKAKFTALGTKL